MKKIFSHKLSFFVLAVVFVWAKTYASYFLEFNLGVKGSTQHMLLFINPLSFTIAALGLALFAKGRRSAIWIIIIDAVMTFALYANVLFYRFFDDFLTFANLKQAGNLGNMSDGVFDIMAFHDIVYFADLIILIALCVKLPELKASQLKKRWAEPLFSAEWLCFSSTLQLPRQTVRSF